MSFVSSLSYEILNYFLNFLLRVFKPELVNQYLIDVLNDTKKLTGVTISSDKINFNPSEQHDHQRTAIHVVIIGKMIFFGELLPHRRSI